MRPVTFLISSYFALLIITGCNNDKRFIETTLKGIDYLVKDDTVNFKRLLYRDYLNNYQEDFSLKMKLMNAYLTDYSFIKSNEYIKLHKGIDSDNSVYVDIKLISKDKSKAGLIFRCYYLKVEPDSILNFELISESIFIDKEIDKSDLPRFDSSIYLKDSVEQKR